MNKMFVSIHRLATCLTAVMFCAVIFGCGSDLPPTAKVQGIVTMGGKPVESGTITFYPRHGRPASGAIQPDGSYRLTTFKEGDGAILGQHKVAILATRVSGGAALKSFEEEMRGVGSFNTPRKIEWLVPERYSRPETTPLTAEVADGPNVLDFNLPAASGGTKR